MNELVFSNEQEWLDLRKGRVGGSQIGTILGYSKYQTDYELWKELIGRKTPKDISDKPCVIRGKSAEKHLVGLYASLHPEKNVQEGNQVIYVSKKNDRFIANVDGFIDDDTVLEIKTATINDWSEWKDSIPMAYYCQCMWYMWITGRRKAELFAMIEMRSRDGKEPVRYLKTYHITYNQQEMDFILEKVNKFMEKVEKKEWNEFSKTLSI